MISFTLRYRLAIPAIVICCLLAASICNAQITSQVAISKTTTPIVIDGSIDEVAWSKAARVSNFGRCDVGKLIVEPDEQTFVYLTYDSDNLYVAARCFQNTEKIIAMATQRDGRVSRDDSFEIYIYPDSGSSNFYVFGENSAAVKYDAMGYDSSWNPTWNVETSITSTYWDAEISIPFASLGISMPVDGADILTNFCRHLQTDGEKLSYGPSNYGFGYTSAWSLGANPASLYDMSNWGKVTFYANTPVARLNQYGALDSGKLGYTGEIVNNTASTANITGQLVATDPNNNLFTSDTGFALGPGSSSAISQMRGCTNYTWKSDSKIYSNGVPILLQGNVKYNPECFSLKKYFFEGNVEPIINIQGLRVLNPATCRFSLWSGSIMINDITLPISLTDSNNLYSHIFFIGTLPPDKYSASCDVRDAGNTALYTNSIAFDKPQDPAWLNSALGTEDVLLSPWTPMSWNQNTRAVSCWGRTYQFNNASPLPSSMVTQGQELLAGPIGINAVINGSSVTWTPTQGINATSSDTKATLITGLAGSNATLSGNTQIEYDGMAKVNLNLTGMSIDTLNSLTLEIPLNKAVATLLLADTTDSVISGSFPFWRGAKNGLIPATTVTGPFTPYMWLGNDRLGLIWFCESQKNWSNARWDNAIEIVPQADKVILKVKFVDSPISLASPLDLTFSLQATPVKPAAKEKKFLMFTGYGQESPNMAVDAPGNGSITYPADGNINLQQGTVHLWTTANFNPNTPVPGLATGYPRYDDNMYPLFSLEYPNSDRFGLYWDATDAKFKVVVRKGDVVMGSYPVFFTANTTWTNGQNKLLSVSWNGSAVSVYANGVQIASGAFSAPFINTLEPAVLRFGGPFTLDAVKISATTYGGGPTYATLDANTLLLDHFTQVAGGLTLPQKSHDNVSGTLNGTWAGVVSGIQLTASKDVVSWIEMWKRRGKEIAHIHENWTETEGYPKTNLHQAEFSSLANGVAQSGMEFMPYFGYSIGDNSPEYQAYKNEIVVEPWVEGYGWHRNDPVQVAYDANYSGQWQNFMVYNAEKLIREQGIGGLYFDGTSIPLPNKNLHSGTGYYDRNGILRPSYPIFEYRKYFKRLRTIAQQYDPNFWMDIHTTVGVWTPVASFADSYWCGEQLEMMMADTGKSSLRELGDAMPLDAYRAWYGSQFGLDGYFLNYRCMRDAEAISLIHNTPVRANDTDPCIERAKDEFGVDNATWYGYYENSAYVDPGDPNVKVSFYKQADGAILFVMSNLGNAASTPTITILPPLGTLRGTDVRDAVSGELITHTDNTMLVSLEPWRVRLIVVNNQTSGDVAYWKFDSSGALGNDSSGHGYDLVKNGVTWSSSKAITAQGTGSASFSGAQTAFSTTGNLNMSGIRKLEVSWWSKFSMSSTSVGFLFEQSENFSQHAGAISVDWENPGRMNFNVSKGPGLSWWTSSISGGNDGQWHFYKAVIDRSAPTVDDFIKFYRDGQLLGQLITHTVAGYDQPFYNGGRMYVGSRADSQNKYVGYLDELKITGITSTNQMTDKSVGDAKKSANGTAVSISGSITAAFGDSIYVESSDRVSGIRIDKPGHGFSGYDVGRIVNVIGSVARDTAVQETHIDADQIITTTYTNLLQPLGITNKSAGGGDFVDTITGNGQVGVNQGTGLNNLGLLVRTTGLVSNGNAGGFTLTDGSGVGLQVLLTGAGSAYDGKYVIVTGVSSIGSDRVRTIKARTANDVQTVN